MVSIVMLHFDQLVLQLTITVGVTECKILHLRFTDKLLFEM